MKDITASSAIARQRGEELLLAVGFLTRIPLPVFEIRSNATLGSAFWAFPLTGALVGACSGVIFWLGMMLGLGATAAAILAVAAGLLATGGLHEDGLSDFWDGLGGGRTRGAKLDIMRDSRLGTYGALALFTMLGLQVFVLVALYETAGLYAATAALVASETAARGAISAPCRMQRPARSEGLGIEMTKLPDSAILGSILITVAVSFLLLGMSGLALIAGAGVGALCTASLAAHFLGGYTGDVLGATAVTARIAALCATQIVLAA